MTSHPKLPPEEARARMRASAETARRRRSIRVPFDFRRAGLAGDYRDFALDLGVDYAEAACRELWIETLIEGRWEAAR